MSFIELTLVLLGGGALVLFVLAIIRPPIKGSAFNRLAVVGFSVLALMLAANVVFRFRGVSERASEMRDWSHQSQHSSEAFIDPDFSTHSGAPVEWTTTEVHTSSSRGVLFIALLVPFAVFALVRWMTNKRVRNPEDEHSDSGWGWIAASAACFLIFGVYFASAKRMEVATLAPPSESEPSMDELMDRYNAPRIQVTAGEVAAATGSPTDQASTASAKILGDAPIAVANSQLATIADDATETAARIEASGHEHPPTATPAAADPFATDAEPPVASDHGREHTQQFVASKTKTTTSRPDWVDQPSRFVGNVQRVVVHAGPYSTRDECDQELRNKMRDVVLQHLADLVREATGDGYPDVPDLERLGITDTLIIREFVADDTFYEDGEASFGLTTSAWRLLEFSEQSNQNLVTAWKSYARRNRVGKTAAVAVMALSVLAGIFTLLKIDTWTRGYYTKRLFLGVPAAIIGAIFLLSFL